MFHFKEKAIFFTRRYGFFLDRKAPMRGIALMTLILVTAVMLAGCGETVSGLGKDVNRMGRGINTFFFRQ